MFLQVWAVSCCRLGELPTLLRSGDSTPDQKELYTAAVPEKAWPCTVQEQDAIVCSILEHWRAAFATSFTPFVRNTSASGEAGGGTLNAKEALMSMNARDPYCLRRILRDSVELYYHGIHMIRDAPRHHIQAVDIGFEGPAGPEPAGDALGAFPPFLLGGLLAAPCQNLVCTVHQSSTGDTLLKNRP